MAAQEKGPLPLGVFCVVTYVAESYQIAGLIRSTLCVGLDVVKFKGRAAIRWISHGIRPAAFLASETVAFQNLRPNSIGNCSVMFWKLPITFKDVNADGEIGTAGSLA